MKRCRLPLSSVRLGVLASPEARRGCLSPVVAFFVLIAPVLSLYAIIARCIARKHWAKLRGRGLFNEFYASYGTYGIVHNRYQSGASFLNHLTGKPDRSTTERDSMPWTKYGSSRLAKTIWEISAAF
ncbi:hypothetical protein [Roseomonas fluvialis]|uniref:hypothetical protein n=1 Tax=Roseomonas fluvialis TaxID=1750527 RepID=UPI001FCDC37B|nr:hypothetical protein [Roseomonas fluvialis]